MANDNTPSATALNSQITDAVTQTNVKVVGEAPAYAMATVYQSLAHSVGILFENAVSTQQQQNILAQASTTQGIMQIYSLDTVATAAGVAKEDGVLGPAQSTAAAVETALPSAAAVTSVGGINNQIEQALKLALDSTLPYSGDVAYGVRAAADALAAALERTNRASQQNLLEMVKNAATTACLTAMIALPDKAAAYEGILDTIRKLR